MAEPPVAGLAGDSKPLEHDDQILDQEKVLPEASQKVVLDLDDAPFLTESPPEKKTDQPAEQEHRSASKNAQAVDASKEDVKSPRRTIFILGGAVLLVLAGVLAFWLTRPVPPPPEPDPPPDLSEDADIPPPAPLVQEHFVDLEPFWIDYAQGDDILFLSLKMSLVTEDPTLVLEIQRKTIILRDAVYYYLNNRPLPSVKRIEAAETLKQDVLSVLNQHLSRPLTGVLIEEYLVQ